MVYDEFISDFIAEGLVNERVVETGKNPADQSIPKVNDDLPQNAKANIADTDDDKDGPKDAGDQSSPDEDPTKPADESKYEDKLMNASVKAMEAAEAAMESICSYADNGKVEYTEEKKRKLHEICEAAKTLREGLYEMANVESYGSTSEGKSVSHNLIEVKMPQMVSMMKKWMEPDWMTTMTAFKKASREHMKKVDKDLKVGIAKVLDRMKI